MKTTRKGNLSAAAVLILAAGVLSLAAQQINSLIIVGLPGSAKVIQRDGHNYVDVEGLASLTQSSFSFKGNQIVMALPGANTNPPTSVAPPAGFSKDFVAAGIEAMAQIQEWRAAFKNAIERNYPLTDSWLAPLRAHAQQALGLASIAVSTTSDKNVLPFLTNEFNNMSTLTDNYLQMSAAMTDIDPRSFDSDPLNQKIISCGHSLASMATANQFIDDGSCR